MAGVSYFRPYLPIYADTWDLNIILHRLRLLQPLPFSTPKVLPLKVVILLILNTGMRVHSICRLFTYSCRPTSSSFPRVFSNVQKMALLVYTELQRINSVRLASMDTMSLTAVIK